MTDDVETGSATRPWYETTKRGYLLDFQMPDSADQAVIGQPANLRNVDAERIVAQLADAGVQALYTHAQDNQGNCYYNTSVGHKHSGIGDHDLLAEFSEHCRARGMKLLFYVQLSRVRRSFGVAAHQARREDGTPVLHTDSSPGLASQHERPVACLNGPHRDYILALVRELAANYEFDGFWLDCFSWWGLVTCCYCDACRMKYQEDTGRDLPSGPQSNTGEWRAYLRWRYRLNRMIYREITDAVRSVNPSLTIAHNGGLARWADHEFYDDDDYVTSEFHFAEGYGGLSLQCRKSAALKPGTPFEKMMWRFFVTRPGGGGDGTAVAERMYRGYQVRPLPMHLGEMSTVLAHDGFIQYYDQINPDGTLDERSLDVLTSAFQAVQEREPWLGSGTEPVEYAALVWSRPTEVYAPPEHGDRHKLGLEGAHHALAEAHVPLAVLTDRQVADGDFGSNKVVVLPNVSCMSGREVERLGEFVRRGGGLVVTHQSSRYDELGEPRDNFALADLLGVDYVEPATYRYTFVQPDVEHQVTSRLSLGWPMTLWSMPQAKVRLHGATALGQVVNPMRGFHMGYPPLEVTPFPSIAVREVGAGRVVYFSGPVDAIYGLHGHPDYRVLLENAVRWAAGVAPSVEVRGPLAVEALARVDHQQNRMVVHLLNRASAGGVRAKGTVVQEFVPLHDVVVRLNGPVRYTSATLQPRGEKLQITLADGQEGGAEIVVPKLDFHDMLVLEA